MDELILQVEEQSTVYASASGTGSRDVADQMKWVIGERARWAAAARQPEAPGVQGPPGHRRPHPGRMNLTETQAAVQQTVREFARDKVAPGARDATLPAPSPTTSSSIGGPSCRDGLRRVGRGRRRRHRVHVPALEEIAAVDQSAAPSSPTRSACSRCRSSRTARRPTDCYRHACSTGRSSARSGGPSRPAVAHGGMRTRARRDGSARFIDRLEDLHHQRGHDRTGFVIIAARTGDEVDGRRSDGAFIVPTDTPGFVVVLRCASWARAPRTPARSGSPTSGYPGTPCWATPNAGCPMPTPWTSAGSRSPASASPSCRQPWPRR